MKLLKKLAILTCALAAFSFVACDSGSSDDGEPNTPVVDEGGEGGEEAGGKTMKKFVVGITADYWKLGELVPQVHYYNESSQNIENSDWSDKNMKLNPKNGIWTWESEEIESDGTETINVIIHSGDTKFLNDTQITIGKPMLYTHAEEFVEWDGTSADTTVAVTKPSATMPALPASIQESDTVVAIDLSQTAKNTGKDNWNPSEENGMQIYGWGRSYTEENNPFGSWPGKAMTNIPETQVWYYVFDSDALLPNSDDTLCFHDGTGENNSDGDRATVTATITAGQKKIVLNSALEDWTSEE